MYRTVPIFLTLIRLTFSPLILPFLLVYLLPYNDFTINSCLALFFIGLSSTDFFDGYFARKFGQVTALGKVLDPLADKFLVYTTIVSLLAVHKIYFYWAIVFIGRDFFMMGLRTVALTYNFTVPVSYFAKVKTIFQMVLFTWIIFNPYQSLGYKHLWNKIEYVLLGVSLFFALWSAKRYYNFFIQEFFIKIKNQEKDKVVVDEV